jgi:hypothetical protein
MSGKTFDYLLNTDLFAREEKTREKVRSWVKKHQDALDQAEAKYRASLEYAAIYGTATTKIDCPVTLPNGYGVAPGEAESYLPMFPVIQETITAGTKRYREVSDLRAKSSYRALDTWFNQLGGELPTQYRYRCGCYKCGKNPVNFITYKSPSEVTISDAPNCEVCK